MPIFILPMFSELVGDVDDGTAWVGDGQRKEQDMNFSGTKLPEFTLRTTLHNVHCIVQHCNMTLHIVRNAVRNTCLWTFSQYYIIWGQNFTKKCTIQGNKLLKVCFQSNKQNMLQLFSKSGLWTVHRISVRESTGRAGQCKVEPGKVRRKYWKVLE